MWFKLPLNYMGGTKLLECIWSIEAGAYGMKAGNFLKINAPRKLFISFPTKVEGPQLITNWVFCLVEYIVPSHCCAYWYNCILNFQNLEACALCVCYALLCKDVAILAFCCALARAQKGRSRGGVRDTCFLGGAFLPHWF